MLDRFTSMEVFLAVARGGTFSHAADELGMSRAMASKHVKALEAHLGVRLFDRTTRAVRLTESGREYHDRIAALLAELASVENRVSSASTDVRGTLDIAAPTSFGAFHLAPVVADFMAAQPDVAVRMTLTERAVDLVEEGIDVAVRVGELEDSAYVARQLTAVRLVTCAAPAYLERHGAPARPADLSQHECVVFGTAPAKTHAEWVFHDGTRTTPVRVRGRFAANAGDAVRALAARGLGIARLPDYIVAAELANGTLVEVLERHAPPLRPVFALYPHRDHVPGKVRAFVEFAMAAFTDAAGDRSAM